MATLGELKARILNETKRPSLTAEVALAISDAIEFYATTRFWFNEALNETITTVADTPSYTIPLTFRKLLRAEITLSGQRRDLCPMSWDDYRDLTPNTAQTGQPTDITFFGPDLYLYPTPNDAWVISLTHCSRLAPFVDDAASNAWTTEAEPLIRARAKWDLYHNVIRDYDEANLVQSVEYAWRDKLLKRSAGYGSATRIAGSGW